MDGVSGGRDTAQLPATVVGTIATNKDIHPGILRNMAAGSMEAASDP